MVQKYYNTQETAKIFGVEPETIKQMLDRRELHGYRDGSDWKFKVEDIDQIAKERQAEKQSAADEDGDVLLSEIELGQSDLGASGTVIGMEKGGSSAADSDIRLADSDIQVAIPSPTAPTPKDDVDSKVAQFEELDLTLEEDLTLDDSSVKLSTKAAGGGSAVDLTGKDLDDDDLVLGGSGTGSDVTIGSDSGISLVDPSDSGLSLEEPLNLSGAAEESLELGEDDMLAAGDSSPSQVKGDDDFLLTPMEDATDDDSESGSQVIALDAGGGDESATMIGSAGGMGMPAMLDEDLTHGPALDLGMGSPMMSGPALSPQPTGFAAGAPAIEPGAVLPEAPYTGLQVTGLVVATVFLMLCGMMMYDLLRNMWSWGSPYAINSSLMDMVLGLFEG